MTPQAWAALRRWHREQAREAFGRYMLDPVGNVERTVARHEAHVSALTEMTRICRAASRKGKQK